MKLCIVLIVLGVLGSLSGPQSVSGHIAENLLKLTQALYYGDVAEVDRAANAENVNLINDLGENSLHVAIKLGDVRIVEKLIEKGANVNHIALDGRSALQVARGQREKELVELLRKHGAH